jgi:hypothetical protein
MELLTYEYQDLEYQELKKHNLLLINFDYILNDAYLKLYPLLDSYSITDLKSNDSIKLLYHSVLLALCDFLKKESKNKEIIIFFKKNKNDNNTRFIVEFLEKLPCQVIFSDLYLQQFVSKLDNRDCMCVEELERCIMLKKDSVKAFQKFKRFLKKWQLLYVVDIYLKQPGNKIMLLR